MNFAIYRFKRIKNGAELGKLLIPVPRFPATVDNIRNPSDNLGELLKKIGVNNYVAESYKFVASADALSATQLAGFQNVFNLDLYSDEKWVLPSGRYIHIVITESSGTLKYYDENDNIISSVGVRGQPFCDVVDLFSDMPLEGKYYYSNIGIEDGKLYAINNIYPLFRGGASMESSFFALDIPEFGDPYEQGGTTGTGGGNGTFGGTGDAIAIPPLPTLSAVDAGFITLFNPTLGQMNNLASYMWSDLFDVNGWKKIFADPMDAILGLSIVPVAVPNGSEKEVKVGNISTGVSMTVASSQYVEVDCGTLNVQEFWGAYLDYDPYTKAEIYLPYIGTHALAVDDIMGKPVHVVYHVDVLSGACCAYVQCGGTVLYTFIGQCSSSIPITGDNWTNVINGAISIAGSIGSMVATGGASAPMAIGNIASTAVNTMKPTVEKSGAMGGTGGMMGVQTPYLILTRPRQALPARQNTFTGYPSFITEQLSTLSGYTEVFKIHLENVPATEQELSEIETLLKAGVIF